MIELKGTTVETKELKCVVVETKELKGAVNVIPGGSGVGTVEEYDGSVVIE